MGIQKRIPNISGSNLIILIAAIIHFLIHMYNAPGYGYFGDEFYTIALSRHLAFGYVDLPPLAPALVALSRALLGESLFALHIVPALAGSAALVFVCLIAKEFGGKSFAVALSALAFISVPIWMGLFSIFCYDCIDQMILAAFLFALVRFLRTGDRRLWLGLGVLAGIACMTKMTMLFLGPGFLAALLLSKHRKDLLTPCPWMGAALCVLTVSPYILWQIANGWPTLEYWTRYGTLRVYDASLRQYLTNLILYLNPFLLPLWAAGLYRVFRRMNGAQYAFLGVLFLITLALMFRLHAVARMLAELFIPLIAAGTVLLEEKLAGWRWEKAGKTAAAAWILAAGIYAAPLSLPILPINDLRALSDSLKAVFPPIQEFNGASWRFSPMLFYRTGWEELVQDIAGVYNALPPEERAVAGIFTEWYMPAGAIDYFGPHYDLPHAVSGALTYYLWGPGYTWEVMLIVADNTNGMEVFFEECELKAVSRLEYDAPMYHPHIFVCRKPKVPAEAIWSSQKLFR
jgi:hypothetical protein